MLPNIIKEKIEGLKSEKLYDFHCSGDEVIMIDNKYILKVSDNIYRLQQELEKDTWVSKYVSSPKPIIFVVENNKAYYLRECIDGEILCLPKFLINPIQVVEWLVEGINILHSAKIEDDHEYVIDEGYNTLIHGDYCLPNILVKNGKINGFVDLGSAGVGDPWRDYAWAIWSLEYNLGTKEYTPLLLEKLGIEFNQEKYDEYIN